MLRNDGVFYKLLKLQIAAQNVKMLKKYIKTEYTSGESKIIDDSNNMETQPVEQIYQAKLMDSDNESISFA